MSRRIENHQDNILPAVENGVARNDLKFFKEERYRRVSRARLQPILNAIRLYHELGV